jgi:DNA processing protein
MDAHSVGPIVAVAIALPPEAWAVALATLPGMGPHRLLACLSLGVERAWRTITAGRAATVRSLAAVMRPDPERLAAAWSSAAASVDVGDAWARHVDAGVGVVLHGGAGYPVSLVDDPEPAPLLFHRGDPDLLGGPRVAIVGTRRCSRYGRDVAFELGRDLAGAGVVVVSGLAVGIDGAAHQGAIAADLALPVAVVGSGLDVVYPRANRTLWRQVEGRGVLLTEAPLGARPARWRFPARNRIIAALSDVVVVVESHSAGGSLVTANQALVRNRVVMAVPGPVRSSASAGTNALLADGAAPARDAGDVLTALGLSAAVHRPTHDSRSPPVEGDRPVLDALGWQPATLEQLADRTGTEFVVMAMALERLLAAGWVSEKGGWWERVARPE